VSLYDWLLFLHVTAAFALVASVVLLAIAVGAAARADRPSRAALALSLTGPSARLFDAGGFGVLFFGVWLAFEADSYALWDGWVVAALVLWVVAAFSGTMAGSAHRKARKLADRLAAQGDAPSDELSRSVRDGRALLLQGVAAAAVLAMLVLMILKPGAG
jgi:uncharacterized membrane protein